MNVKRESSLLIAIVILAAAVGSASSAAEPTLYESVLARYETIRQALLHDSLDGVAEAASKIEHEARGFVENFDPATAGVEDGQTEACRALLPELAEAASKVAGATSLDAARTGFGMLSRSMVRFRQLAAAPDSVVVHCAMADEVWVQPKGAIGNPYYGQSMASCGQVVSE